MTLPEFGLGTFRLQGETVINSVENALDLGYRYRTNIWQRGRHWYRNKK